MVVKWKGSLTWTPHEFFAKFTWLKINFICKQNDIISQHAIWMRLYCSLKILMLKQLSNISNWHDLTEPFLAGWKVTKYKKYNNYNNNKNNNNNSNNNRPVRRAVTHSSLDLEVWGSNLRSVKSDAVLPTAHHYSSDSSSKEAVLPTPDCKYLNFKT